MEPRIEQYPAKTLAGLSFFGDPFQGHAGWTEANEIGRLWKRLMNFWQQSGMMENPVNMPAFTYELHLQNNDTLQTGEYEVFVGYEITCLDDLPLELCAKVLPEALYAVFTLRGSQIMMEEPLIDEWLAAAPYEIMVPVYIQRYDERFKGLDRIDESEMDLLIPVRQTVG